MNKSRQIGSPSDDHRCLLSTCKLAPDNCVVQCPEMTLTRVSVMRPWAWTAMRAHEPGSKRENTFWISDRLVFDASAVTVTWSAWTRSAGVQASPCHPAVLPVDFSPRTSEHCLATAAGFLLFLLLLLPSPSLPDGLKELPGAFGSNTCPLTLSYGDGGARERAGRLERPPRLPRPDTIPSLSVFALGELQIKGRHRLGQWVVIGSNHRPYFSEPVGLVCQSVTACWTAAPAVRP